MKFIYICLILLVSCVQDPNKYADPPEKIKVGCINLGPNRTICQFTTSESEVCYLKTDKVYKVPCDEFYMAKGK